MTMHCVRWAKLGTCARDGSAYLGPGHKNFSIGTTDPAHSGCFAAAVQTHAAVWPAQNWHAMSWLLRGAERRAAAQSGAKRTLGLQGCSGKVAGCIWRNVCTTGLSQCCSQPPMGLMHRSNICGLPAA